MRSGSGSDHRTGVVSGGNRCDGVARGLAGPLQPDELPKGPVVCLDEQSWSNHGSRHLGPMAVGDRLWIARDDKSICPAGRIAVILVPGLGFGTGDHPTTRLCLEWLEQTVEPGATVLDYGCGSGILAIAALKLGAAHAWAVDIDPQALAATEDNARRNQVADRISVSHPQGLTDTVVDILAANILCKPLLALAPAFAGLLRSDGTIGLSGILTAQTVEIRDTYCRWFTLAPPAHLDERSLVAGTRKPG